jgi:hypothetical protein
MSQKKIKKVGVKGAASLMDLVRRLQAAKGALEGENTALQEAGGDFLEELNDRMVALEERVETLERRRLLRDGEGYDEEGKERTTAQDGGSNLSRDGARETAGIYQGEQEKARADVCEHEDETGTPSRNVEGGAGVCPEE